MNRFVRPGTPGKSILLAACAGVMLLMLFRLYAYSAYGFDFTDEGFALAWISDPFLYKASVTQFGFAYHPIYLLSGGDLVVLRQVNIGLVFGLSWTLSALWLKSLAPEVTGEGLTLAILSAGLATTGFTLFGGWMLTPSYNSLALQALMLTAIGLLLSEEAAAWKASAGCALAGLGGWLAFLAKPTTAAALAVVMLVYLVVAPRLSLGRFLVAVGFALALLAVTALAQDGSIINFVARLQDGFGLTRHLDAGYGLTKALRLDHIPFGPATDVVIIAILLGFALVLGQAPAPGKMARAAVLGLSAAIVALAAALALGLFVWPGAVGAFLTAFRLRWLVVALMLILVLLRWGLLTQVPTVHWARAGLFLTLPHVFAFGTNGNYWLQGSMAALFWILGGTVFLRSAMLGQRSWTVLVPLVVVVQAVVAGLLLYGFRAPYRQPQPIDTNAALVEIGTLPSRLILSDGYADYIRTAGAVARDAGFVPGTPIIDLSGESPGLLQAFGAVNLGLPWLIGGYPGSEAYVSAALGFVPCAPLATAWVLVEPDGARRIPETVIAQVGADFPRSYALVGAWQVASGAGGRVWRGQQKLFRPLAVAETVQACARLRSTQKQ